MQITKDQLKQWSACRDGYEWFLRKFPDGNGTYHDIVTALYADKRPGDARWLADNCYREFGVTEFSRVELASLDAMTAELNSLEHPADSELCSSGYDARIGSSGNYAQIGSSGNYAQIGSSGNYAQIGSSGDGAQIGSSGDGAQIGSSGDGAQIGSSGNYARIGSSGNYARIGSSGDGAQIGSSGNYAQIGSGGYDAQIEATGKNAVVAAAGSVTEFTLGEGGCISLPYSDGSRTRFAVAYVGENGIEAGVKYRLNDQHQFEPVDKPEADQQAA